MTFQTTIHPSGYHFPIEEQETILAAALRHGYTLPYSCREGVCGVCKGKVMEGQVDHGNHLGSALTEMDKAAGMTLFCCARPKSDLVIECQTAGKISDIAVQRGLPDESFLLNAFAPTPEFNSSFQAYKSPF